MDDEDNRIQTAGRNVIGWFEMPIRRLNQADIDFYTNVFGFNIDVVIVNGRTHGIIKGGATNPGDIYGALVVYPAPQPMPFSCMHYFRANDLAEFTNIINNVVAQGGIIVNQPANHRVLLTNFAICTDNQGTQFGVIINPN